jgi:hypothetical protein
MPTRASDTPWLVDGANGNPLAPPSVVAQLKAIDDRLDLQYHVGLRAFMITLRWREHDPRRQMIRDGQIAPHADFSILAPIPDHVSLDDVSAWVEAQLTRVSASDAEVRAMIEAHEAKQAKANDAVFAAKADEAAHELIEAVANPAPAHGRRRTKVA